MESESSAGPLRTPGSAMAVGLFAIVLGVIQPMMPVWFGYVTIGTAYLCSASILILCWSEGVAVWRHLRRKTLSLREISKEFCFVAAIAVFSFGVTSFALVRHVEGVDQGTGIPTANQIAEATLGDKAGANIEVGEVSIQTDPNDERDHLFIAYSDTGSRAYQSLKYSFGASIYSDKLSAERETALFNNLFPLLKPLPTVLGDVIQPDVPATSESDPLPENIKYTVMSGEKLFYVMVLYVYKDSLLSGNQMRVTEVCRVYRGSMEAYHLCLGHNRFLPLVVGPLVKSPPIQ